MNNREYWRERMRALEEKGYRESEAYYEELKKKFTSANNQIQMDIDRWYHRLAENNNISYASAAKFLNKSELEEFQWSVWEYIRKGKENALNQEWMKELENASANVHISYLQSMKIQLQQHAEELYTQYEKGMTQLLTNRYTNGFYETAYEIAKGTGVGVNLSQLNTRQIDIVLTTPWAQDGKIFSDRIWENKEKLVRELNTELTQCIIRGEHPDRAAARLAKTMGVKRTQAKTLVQTEAAAITMKAQQSCFKELEIEEYEIEETLDSFTCSFCGEMDGKHFTMSEYEVGVTAPPFHPRCRGCTCPYFHDEFTVNEKRGARKENGDTYDVPADITYKEWKKKYVGQAEEKEKNEIQYMSNSFRPQYGKRNTLHVDQENIDVKTVENSAFKMFTDVDAERRNKAVRLAEKTFLEIREQLPAGFELPEIAVIDFERHNLRNDAIGGYQRETDRLYINSKYDTKEKILKFVNKQKGKFANTTEYAPYLHELGHKYYEDCIKTLAKTQNITYNRAKLIIDARIEKYVHENNNYNQTLLNSVSAYADDGFGKNNYTETVAECFSIRAINAYADGLLKQIEGDEVK
ncbi:MAG: minor capsid protein [Candidatus Gastranaerophilaceae bacterium]